MYQIKYTENNKECFSREYSENEFKKLKKDLKKMLKKDSPYQNLIILSNNKTHPYSSEIIESVEIGIRIFPVECFAVLFSTIFLLFLLRVIIPIQEIKETRANYITSPESVSTIFYSNNIYVVEKTIKSTDNKNILLSIELELPSDGMNDISYINSIIEPKINSYDNKFKRVDTYALGKFPVGVKSSAITYIEEISTELEEALNRKFIEDNKHTYVKNIKLDFK